VKVRAVIGAGYGDEGKGHVVDYLAPGNKTLVIRFNGGAQAGHTVVLPDGRRHVFHHIGSGALVGADTFLGADFLANPIIFQQEMQALEVLGVTPRVFADPDVRITTPWDMIINQELEKQRGPHRHGSCGLGINETMKRSEVASFRISDLFRDTSAWVRKLHQILQVYVPARFEELKLSKPAIVDEPKLMNRFIADLVRFRADMACRSWDSALPQEYTNIIFEGAQGLRLDQGAPGFPHVTHSNTGLTNVARMMREANLDELDVFYVTRPYLTRHGEGPLEHELSGKPTPLVEDKTNIPNEWQGSLRFAPLDLGVLQESIVLERGKVPGVGLREFVVLTCMDHMEQQIEWAYHGMLKTADKKSFPYLMPTLLRRILVSYGPSRDCIIDLVERDAPSLGVAEVA
jgi:adenylosuccinate synthase